MNTIPAAKLPTQQQLFFPLLGALAELGGEAQASDVIERVAERVGVSPEVCNDFREVDCGRWGVRRRSAFRQRVHWIRLSAVHAGLLEEDTRYGYWKLSEKGRGSLHRAQPGVILTVYETPDGEVVWADAVTAAGMLAPNSIDLVFSSPPYPILAGRGYGTYTEGEIIDLVVKAARLWRDALQDHGSIVLNFKDVWLPKAQTGGCVRSLYQEKLLLALCDDVKLVLADKFVWNNPSHLPDNPWVTIRKVRTNCAHENLFWFAKTANPRANNQNILTDAAPSTIEAYRRKAARQYRGLVGPSGHNNLFEEQMGAVAAGQALKVIPRNVLEFSNADTHRKLAAILKDMELPRHDAMMPVRLAEHFIKFLTNEGDVVHDGFWGGGSTGVACKRQKRRFIGSDIHLAHILASAPRFEEVRYSAV